MTTAARWIGAGLGVAAVGYGTWVCATWLLYGRRTRPAPGDADPLLDGFMPDPDVAERHHIHVAAPAGLTLATALATDLEQSAIVRGIIRTRALVLGAPPDRLARPRGLLAQMTSLGWGVLAEVPGREHVFGAVTQPWQSNVVFRALPPDAFAAFDEPGLVKIAWTLRVDPLGANTSMLRTDTRAVATDPIARRTFRWYWARFSPGIVLIRILVLRMVKTEAERAWRRRGSAC